ncbi:MAG: hypothetical protein ACWGP1_01635, partial [Syntrophobacteria bacterium]
DGIDDASDIAGTVIQKSYHLLSCIALEELKLPAVRLRRTTGNALALLNFPKGTLFNRASWSIFSNGVSYTTISIKTSLIR